MLFRDLTGRLMTAYLFSERVRPLAKRYQAVCLRIKQKSPREAGLFFGNYLKIYGFDGVGLDFGAALAAEPPSAVRPARCIAMRCSPPGPSETCTLMLRKVPS